MTVLVALENAFLHTNGSSEFDEVRATQSHVQKVKYLYIILSRFVWYFPTSSFHFVRNYAPVQQRQHFVCALNILLKKYYILWQKLINEFSSCLAEATKDMCACVMIAEHCNTYTETRTRRSISFVAFMYS